MKERLLIISKTNDATLPFFQFRSVKDRIDIDVLLIEEEEDTIRNYLLGKQYNYIYFREVLTSKLTVTEVEKKMNLIFNLLSGTSYYSVDSINSFQDLLFEDKWIQYNIFKEFMPFTRLLSEFKPGESDYIIKKRISSRGKDIYFDIDDIPEGVDNNEYIVQHRLDIIREYRVYDVFGKILDKVAFKQAKTESKKVQIIGAADIDSNLKSYARRVSEKHNLDLVGYDFALLKDGSYLLLEVNRACFWNGINRYISMNPADNLIDKLLEMKNRSS